MSLINQMLKDLDARRSDGAAGGSFGAQIRVVTPRKRIHPAWWTATALGGALAGALAFALLRPQPPVQTVPIGQLPLRMDVGLSAAPAAGSQPIPETAGADSAPKNPVAPDTPAAVDMPVPPVPAQAAAVPEKKPAPVRAPAAAPVAKKASPVPPVSSLPEAARVVPAAKALVPVAETPAQPLPHKQIKELTPAQRAENEYRKAMIALQQGKRTDAIAGLELSLQVEPKHAAARNALVGLLLDSKQQEEAMQKAREGLEADPAQTGMAMILARLQLEKGELHPAVETLERTLPHAAGRPDYVAFLAALLQREGRHRQAAEYYLQALQKSPQNGLWWMGLGISLQAEQRLPEAQEAFKRAKATNSLSNELLAFVEARLSQLQN